MGHKKRPRKSARVPRRIIPSHRLIPRKKAWKAW